MSRLPTHSLKYFDLFDYRHKIHRKRFADTGVCADWVISVGQIPPGRCSENDRFTRMKYTSKVSYHFKDHELLSITSIFTIVEYVICIFST